MEEQDKKIQKADYNGLYYPSDPNDLNDVLDMALAKSYTLGPDLTELKIRALIVPSIGYTYASAVASSAYRELVGRSFKKVVVIGPSHFIVFQGMALSESELFESPLGMIPVDKEVNEKLAMDFNFTVNEMPFMKEYSIELQLPFLQKFLKDFTIVPLVLGSKINYADVATKLQDILDNDTLLIISTNLSHYLSDDKARKVDQDTINLLLAKDTEGLIAEGQASALSGLAVLTEIAKAKNWQPMFVSYGNTAEGGDDPSSVVGFGGLVYISE